MSPTALALRRAESRLLERLEQLEARLDAGDAAAWMEYGQLAAALAAILPQTFPGSNGQLLSTKEMAARLQIAPRTLLRRKAKGLIAAPVQLGKRGPGALRWRGDEVARLSGSHG